MVSKLLDFKMKQYN